MTSIALRSILLLTLAFALLVTSAIAATLPSYASMPQSFADASNGQQQQVAFDICPELNVRCVVDGDWRHPIGYLGKRRECEPITIASAPSPVQKFPCP